VRIAQNGKRGAGNRTADVQLLRILCTRGLGTLLFVFSGFLCSRSCVLGGGVFRGINAASRVGKDAPRRVGIEDCR